MECLVRNPFDFFVFVVRVCLEEALQSDVFGTMACLGIKLELRADAWLSVGGKAKEHGGREFDLV